METFPVILSDTVIISITRRLDPSLLNQLSYRIRWDVGSRLESKEARKQAVAARGQRTVEDDKAACSKSLPYASRLP